MNSKPNPGGIALNVFLPALLIMITLILQGWTQRVEFANRLVVLNTQERQQEPILQQAQTLRQQLESIAGATAMLAEQGNANAVIIREQLKTQGISINPPQ